MGDRFIYNTNERASSEDFVNEQDLIAGVHISAYADRDDVVQTPLQFGGTQNVRRSMVVTQGLEIGKGGGNVIVIQPGTLIQRSATIPAAQRTYENIRRIGTTRSAVNIALPADSWAIVEAQVEDVTALTTPRDVLTGGVSVPTNVPKIVRRQLQFRVRAGTATNFPAPETDFSWVPLWAIQVSGADFEVTEAIDLRPMPHQFDRRASSPSGPRDRGPFRLEGIGDAIVTGPTMRAQFGAKDNFVEMSFEGTFDPSDAIYLDPGTTLTNGEWYYLYLVSIDVEQNGIQGDRIAPRNPYRHSSINEPFAVQGLLVASGVAPTGLDGAGQPSALPAPFNNCQASVGVHVGCVRRAAGGWTLQNVSSAGEAYYTPTLSDFVMETVTSGSPANGATLSLDTSNRAPRGVEALIVAEVDVIDAGQTGTKEFTLRHPSNGNNASRPMNVGFGATMMSAPSALASRDQRTFDRYFETGGVLADPAPGNFGSAQVQIRVAGYRF
jgi:hypothetical protein